METTCLNLNCNTKVPENSDTRARRESIQGIMPHFSNPSELSKKRNPNRNATHKNNDIEIVTKIYNEKHVSIKKEFNSHLKKLNAAGTKCPDRY